MNFPDEILEKMWNSFNWDKIESNLLEMQCQLSKAAFKYQKDNVKELSIKITNCLSFKALAVKKVSEDLNSASGIDNVKWLTPVEKMKATLSLNPKNYKAKPFKRFIIKDSKNGKERRINIPTIFDRAMQILYMFALDPISEATADRKSFAFRKGRSTFDVHSLIINFLNEKDFPMFVLICDVKSYYDSISHKWLLNNIPMSKPVLREFIEAGIVFNNEVFPTDVGISLGCNISTILGNMTLDGLQKLLYDLQGDKVSDYWQGYVIRFADDILVTARSKDDALKFKRVIEDFLRLRGLKLSESKTQIKNVFEGFEFLSRFYFKKEDQAHSIPSEKSIMKLENDLMELILNNPKRWSQKNLIQTLNSKLIGWATYQKVTEATDTFKHIDVVVNALILRLMHQMYPNKTTAQLTKKYWFKENNKFIFSLPTNKSIRIIQLSDIVLIKPSHLDTKQNVYLDKEYFDNRNEIQEINRISGKFKTIWNRQDGKCYYCNKSIKPDQPKKIVIKNPCIKDTTIKNMAYIHSYCAYDELVFINSNLDKNSKINVEEILKEINDPTLSNFFRKENKYSKLYDYFTNCNKYSFQLKFSEIEKIIDNKLCNSLYKYDSYWRQSKNGSIASSWLKNGYRIKKLYLKEKKVTFIRTKKATSKLEIPEQLQSSNLPKSAKAELEQFFYYIIDKYGL